jgi:hypothetical protein
MNCNMNMHMLVVLVSGKESSTMCKGRKISERKYFSIRSKVLNNLRLKAKAHMKRWRLEPPA